MKRRMHSSASRFSLKKAGVFVSLASSLLLTGCFSGSSSSSGGSEPVASAPLFPENGQFEATIRRTAHGVLHIKADTLASAAYGHGYVQAQDNVCLLAEAVVKARSERAKYFGMGDNNINVINDFSYKAQKILSGAEAGYDSLSSENKALVKGFTAGYNQYVVDTPPSDLPEECRDQPWVKEIHPVDLLAHYRIIGQYASGALFATGAVYIATPGEDESAAIPQPVMLGVTEPSLNSVSGSAYELASEHTDFQDFGLGSNAWAIGKDMTEQGRGALLSNPHFPYTGHRRLYQVQMTVPGYLNINGAGLLGTAIPLINFNENLAWSHTVSTSRRFTLYELTLKDGDPLTYIKDGVEKPITKETYQIEVNVGAPEPIFVERDFYFSEYGPMVSGNAITQGGLPKWGDDGKAYTYRDANANTSGLLDTWLAMSRASNLDEFQDVFRSCGSTLWTNSTYADDQGNAFHIDSSSAPNLSDSTLGVIDFKRRVSPQFNQLFNEGLTLLDGSTSRDDWIEGSCNDGLVPYDKKPKLLRTDWVQNSNSSHWATNPASFLTGYSAMFGEEKAGVNARTRLAIDMLQNPTDPGLDANTPTPVGQDGKFSAEDLIGVIWNNRGWYAEQFLLELLERCTIIGADEVSVTASLLPTDPLVAAPDSGVRSVQAGCVALAGWNGTYDLDSTAAHTFRAFIDIYNRSFPDDLTVAFNPQDPVNTPAKPSTADKGTVNDPMLMSLAAALTLLDDAGIDYDAPLELVQFYWPSGGALPGQEPVDQGKRIPWHGGDASVDGAFNAMGVADTDVKEDTVFPRIRTPEYTDANGWFAAGLSANKAEGWRVDRGTSWHFGLEFTDNGPEAYGLLSYSQSTDSASPYFIDQAEMYSRKEYRKLFFTETEISRNLVSEETIRQ